MSQIILSVAKILSRLHFIAKIVKFDKNQKLKVAIKKEHQTLLV
jgi:hypothetical protein